MGQPQRVRRGDGQRRRWLALTGQDVENDIAADRTVAQRLGACRFHCLDAVTGDGGQDANHLPITIGMAAKPPPHPLDGGRQCPVLERCAVPQRAGLSRQHRHIVPGIIDRLLASEPAGVFGYDLATLADDDPVCIGMDLNRSSCRLRMDRVFVVIESNQQGL